MDIIMKIYGAIFDFCYFITKLAFIIRAHQRISAQSACLLRHLLIEYILQKAKPPRGGDAKLQGL